MRKQGDGKKAFPYHHHCKTCQIIKYAMNAVIAVAIINVNK